MDFSGLELIIERENQRKFVPVEADVEFPDQEIHFSITIDNSDIPYNQDGGIVFVEDQMLVGPIDFSIEITYENGVVEKHVKTIGDKPAENLDQLSNFLSVWLEGTLRENDLPHAPSRAFNELFSELILSNIDTGAITVIDSFEDDDSYRSVKSGDELQDAILALLGNKRNVRIDYIVNECRSLGYRSDQVQKGIANLIASGEVVKNRNTGAIQRA